jgi:hypothetical protein
MAYFPSPAVEAVLFASRIASPTLLLFVVLSLFTLRKASPPDATPITAVIVPVLTPRRSLILTLVSIATLTYLCDATVVILRAVVGHTWEGSDPTWKGIEVADVLGFIAFGGLNIVGSWRDAKGIRVWESTRLKFYAVAAVLFEIAHVTLLALSVKVWQGKRGPSSSLI